MGQKQTARHPAMQAVMDAFMQRTGERGVQGAPLTVAFAFGVLLDDAPFPATGLRDWAQILNAAAERMEAKSA